MAKKKDGSKFWKELLSLNVYKRNQGRLARQLTAAGIALIIVLGAYTLSEEVLTSYVDSYYIVKVGYQDGPDNRELYGSVESLADEYGGSVAADRLERKRQEIEVHFPTSYRWTPRFQFDVVLDDAGDKLDQVVGVIEEETGASSASIKKLISSLPKPVVEDQTRDDADRIVAAIVALDGVAQAKEKVEQFADEVKLQLSAVRVSSAQHRSDRDLAVSVGFPVLLSVLGIAFAWRVVHYSRFADFLISVQGELDKVSWPSRDELRRSTIVVVVVMFALGALLLCYDLAWSWILKQIGVLKM